MWIFVDTSVVLKLHIAPLHEVRGATPKSFIGQGTMFDHFHVCVRNSTLVLHDEFPMSIDLSGLVLGYFIIIEKIDQKGTVISAHHNLCDVMCRYHITSHLTTYVTSNCSIKN